MNHSKEIYCTKGKHYVDSSLFKKRKDRPKSTHSWCNECRSKNDKERHQIKISEVIIKAF